MKTHNLKLRFDRGGGGQKTTAGERKKIKNLGFCFFLRASGSWAAPRRSPLCRSDRRCWSPGRWEPSGSVP